MINILDLTATLPPKHKKQQKKEIIILKKIHDIFIQEPHDICCRER